MALRGPAIGELRHRVFVQTLTATPDGAGGQTETWGAIAGAMSEPVNDGTAETGTPVWLALDAAGVQNVERLFGNRVQAAVSFVATCRYRSDVTARMRIRWHAGAAWRTLAIRGLQEEGALGGWLRLACEDVTT